MNDFLKTVFGFITFIFIVYLFAAYEKAEDEQTQFNLVKSTTKVIHEIMTDAQKGWEEAQAADSIQTDLSPEIQ